MPRILVLALLSLALVVPGAQAAKPGDSDALQGVEQGRLLWDITQADAIKLGNWLTVIRDTYEGLERQGVTPHMVLVFRGQAVRLLAQEVDDVPFEQLGMIDEVHSLLAEIRSLPRVRLEACNLALRRQGMEDKPLVPGVKVVTNTFMAIAGYNEKGYARIPVN
ncbi:MAG TPA: hypothetical protein VJ985_06175 [Gammaproteobacteria bacterium]|nr:hypothetical protein [Gammaproteobacteria bacterium]